MFARTFLYISMVAYFCHHLSNNYVGLSDLYFVLSDLYFDLSDLYVDLCAGLTEQNYLDGM